MLFIIANVIFESIQCDGGFYFNIAGEKCFPYWDDEDVCYVSINGSQARVNCL